MFSIVADNTLLILLVAAWTLPWKGVALWKAARASHKKWFVALLVVNTLAVLEILYIFVFSKRRRRTEIVEATAVEVAEGVSK